MIMFLNMYFLIKNYNKNLVPSIDCTCQEKVDTKKEIYEKPRSVLNKTGLL